MEATNLANVNWRLLRTPVSDKTLRRAGPGLRLPGYRFPEKPDPMNFLEADLTGSSIAN